MIKKAASSQNRHSGSGVSNSRILSYPMQKGSRVISTPPPQSSLKRGTEQGVLQRQNRQTPPWMEPFIPLSCVLETLSLTHSLRMTDTQSLDKKCIRERQRHCTIHTRAQTTATLANLLLVFVSLGNPLPFESHDGELIMPNSQQNHIHVSLAACSWP